MRNAVFNFNIRNLYTIFIFSCATIFLYVTHDYKVGISVFKGAILGLAIGGLIITLYDHYSMIHDPLYQLKESKDFIKLKDTKEQYYNKDYLIKLVNNDELKRSKRDENK